MRVKRTLAEGIKVRRKHRRQRFMQAIVVGVFVTLMTTFLFSDLEWGRERHFFVPVDEILHRLPISVFCGVGAGLFFWWLSRREKWI
jgi:hypothetical protein